MKNVICCLILICLSNTTIRLAAQDSTAACEVRMSNLNGSYKGECKDGLAHGQGEAIGLHRYKGAFKFGKPNGYGVYYYDDTTYYMGLFLDGQKEGKGETHYVHASKPDSIIKGFWSGDIFRGKSYVTYDFNGASLFDRYEISPTREGGHTISFEISTTSGSPTGVPSDLYARAGYVLKLTELTAINDVVVKVRSTVETPTRFHVTYDIDKFPVILYATMSNGNNFKLELYKPANWTVRLFLNK